MKDRQKQMYFAKIKEYISDTEQSLKQQNKEKMINLDKNEESYQFESSDLEYKSVKDFDSNDEQEEEDIKLENKFEIKNQIQVVKKIEFYDEKNNQKKIINKEEIKVQDINNGSKQFENKIQKNNDKLNIDLTQEKKKVEKVEKKDEQKEVKNIENIVQKKDEKLNLQKIDQNQAIMEDQKQKQKKQIQVNKLSDVTDYLKDFKADKKVGGLYVVNEELLTLQKGVLLAMLKQIGGNIIRGQSALNVSLPVQVFDKKTFLQRIAKTFAFSPSILKKAAKEKDQLQAFKYSISFIISLLNLSIDQRKPFNPIIGETYQGFIDNYPIFLEQISHHPPISSFLYLHKDFSLYGNWEQYAQLNFNSVLAQYIGIAVIAFEDREILFTLPQCSVYNISIGKRYVTYDKECYIYDAKNMLLCQLFFNYSKNKSEKQLNPHQKQVDYFSGKIYRMKTEVQLTDNFKLQKNSYSEILSDVLGVWHQFLQIDNQIYWRLDMYPACDIVNHENPLPSDSTLRPDLAQFQNNNMEQAQNEKIQIEENQRLDVAQRKQYKKK